MIPSQKSFVYIVRNLIKLRTLGAANDKQRKRKKTKSNQWSVTKRVVPVCGENANALLYGVVIAIAPHAHPTDPLDLLLHHVVISTECSLFEKSL